MKILTLFICLSLSQAQEFNPYWWNERHPDGVSAGYRLLPPERTLDDNAELRIGQLKHAVFSLVEYLKGHVIEYKNNTSAAGNTPKRVPVYFEEESLSTLTRANFFKTTHHDHKPVTFGQLQTIIKPIYDLIETEYRSGVHFGSHGNKDPKSWVSWRPTNGFTPRTWDTDWLNHERFTSMSILPDPSHRQHQDQEHSPSFINRWKTANPQKWNIIDDSNYYPWTSTEERKLSAKPATIYHLKTAFSLELPLADVRTYPSGTNWQNLRFPSSKSSPEESSIFYAYSPQLKLGQKAPLIIALPGWPNGKSIGITGLQQFLQMGRHRGHLIAISSNPQLLLKESTQTPDKLTIQATIEAFINNELENVHSSVDLDRIYLVAHSGGCIASMHLMAKYPDFYAGALLHGIPVSAYHPGSTNPKVFSQTAAHIPIMAIRGYSESLAAIKSPEKYEELIDMIKTANPNSKSMLLRLPGGHGSGMNSMTGQFQNLAWLFDQRK